MSLPSETDKANCKPRFGSLCRASDTALVPSTRCLVPRTQFLPVTSTSPLPPLLLLLLMLLLLLLLHCKVLHFTSTAMHSGMDPYGLVPNYSQPLT